MMRRWSLYYQKGAANHQKTFWLEAVKKCSVKRWLYTSEMKNEQKRVLAEKSANVTLYLILVSSNNSVLLHLHFVLRFHCSSSSSFKLFRTGFVLRLQDRNISIITMPQTGNMTAMCIQLRRWYVTWAQFLGLRSGYEAARWSPAVHPVPSEVSSCCSRVSLSLPLPHPAASSVPLVSELTTRAV